MLEPRLFPLLETLTRADLDWLAQEIISGALAGRVPEESRETLQAARGIVFRRAQDSGALVPRRSSEERAEAFSADEQIEWAAQHVVQRLQQALEMLRDSIDRLDEISQREKQAKHSGSTGANITLVLSDRDSVYKTDRAQLAAALEGLSELRGALGIWAAEALGGEQT